MRRGWCSSSPRQALLWLLTAPRALLAPSFGKGDRPCRRRSACHDPSGPASCCSSDMRLNKDNQPCGCPLPCPSPCSGSVSSRGGGVCTAQGELLGLGQTWRALVSAGLPQVSDLIGSFCKGEPRPGRPQLASVSAAPGELGALTGSQAETSRDRHPGGGLTGFALSPEPLPGCPDPEAGLLFFFFFF